MLPMPDIPAELGDAPGELIAPIFMFFIDIPPRLLGLMPGIALMLGDDAGAACECDCIAASSCFTFACSSAICCWADLSSFGDGDDAAVTGTARSAATPAEITVLMIVPRQA